MKNTNDIRKNIACIILAAGKGERMKSKIPKVLHPLCGRPMLLYVLDLVRDLRIQNNIIVIGYKQQEVKKLIPPEIKIVTQRRLLGTADAVKTALPKLKNFKGTVLVLYADNPLLKRETIEKLLKYQRENKLDAALLTAQLDDPAGYGRILRDKYGTICGIVEEKDADDFQKEIKEINTGIMCFQKNSLAPALKSVRSNNTKKEFYLTDTIAMLSEKGGLIDNVQAKDTQDVLGINSRLQLAKANEIMQRRINEKLLKDGVTVVSVENTFISFGVSIGEDTVIYPFTVIEKDVKIGKRCQVGPFIHLREGTRLADEVKVGNFLEVNRTQISTGTVAKHFGYLGDSRIGRGVNIGAGTVTANFDGKKKSITVIEDKAFIGSDTVLIAPVKVGKAAITGAGSVLAKKKNVPAGSVVTGVPARILRKR